MPFLYAAVSGFLTTVEARHPARVRHLKAAYKPQDWAAYSPKVLRGSPAWPTNAFLMGFGDSRYLADYMYDLWIVK